MKKALVYARVSDAEQLKGISIEVQIEKCSKWASDNNYHVVGVYKDEAKSGTKFVGRDGLEDLIIQCQSEHIDIVLVVDTDRIARNEFDHFNIKKELLKAKTALFAVNQPMIDDSPEGKLMDGMLASINAFYSRLTGKKVKNSLQKKCQDGWWPAAAPLGYINVNRGTEDKPKREIAIDPERSPHIREMFRLFSTQQYSVDELGDLLYEDGLKSKRGKKISRSILYAMLKNRFYIGYFEYSGVAYTGKHEPLVSTELFETCQKILKNNNHNACRRRKYKWLLSGIAYCNDCGSRFHCSYNQKKEVAYYHGSYRLGCNEYMPLKDLEEKVAELLKSIKFSDEFKQLVISKAKDLVKNSRGNKENELQTLGNKVKALEAKRAVLEDNLLDETIDKETFKRKHAEISKEIQNYENNMANVENQRVFDIDVVLEILTLTDNLYETYQNASFEAKRHYLGIFFDKVEVSDKKIRKVEYSLLFKQLLEANKVTVSSNWLPVWDFIRTMV